jgi:hypothetical protein
MKVLIGVDPHKASVAVAAVEEATSELVERASFPQDRTGLRALERWAMGLDLPRMSGSSENLMKRSQRLPSRRPWSFSSLRRARACAADRTCRARTSTASLT